jgi:ketosteroid isomerase-like protein
MSKNMDLVRSIFANWERGDFGGTAGLHPDIAWEYVGGPEPGSGSGLAAMARPMRDWLHAWERWTIEATDYRGEAGAYRVRRETLGARPLR